MGIKFTSVAVQLTGVTPLLMHNGHLADPCNPFAKAMKEISSKKKKTDSDHEELRWREFVGSLYFSDELGPYVPSDWIESCIRDGARKVAKGKSVVAGVSCVQDQIKLAYKGPRDAKAMYADNSYVDCRGVKVSTARVMRTRPRFKTWGVSFDLQISEDTISAEDTRRALEVAGRLVGLGDFRPKFGQFTVDSFRLTGEIEV